MIIRQGANEAVGLGSGDPSMIHQEVETAFTVLLYPHGRSGVRFWSRSNDGCAFAPTQPCTHHGDHNDDGVLLYMNIDIFLRQHTVSGASWN